MTVDEKTIFAAKAAPASAWRDIASAPKDGTKLLVYAQAWDWDNMLKSSGNPMVPAPDCRVAAWRNDEAGWWAITNNPYSDIALNPTHWRPLPASPGESHHRPIARCRGGSPCEILLKMHPAVLEGVIRGALEVQPKEDCASPIKCAQEIMAAVRICARKPVSLEDCAKAAAAALIKLADEKSIHIKHRHVVNSDRVVAKAVLDAANVPYNDDTGGKP